MCKGGDAKNRKRILSNVKPMLKSTTLSGAGVAAYTGGLLHSNDTDLIITSLFDHYKLAVIYKFRVPAVFLK